MDSSSTYGFKSLRDSHANPVTLQSSSSRVNASITKLVPKIYHNDKNGPAPVEVTKGVDRCAELSYQVHVLQQQLDQARARLKQTYQRVPKEEKMVRELTGMSETQRRELIRFRSELERLTLENSVLEQEREELKKDKERLLKVLRRYQNPSTGPAKQLEELRQELMMADEDRMAAENHHAQVVNMLDKEIIDLKRDSEAAQLVGNKAVGGLRAANDRIAELEGESNQLRTLLIQAQHESDASRQRAEEAIRSSEEAIQEFESRCQQAIADAQQKDAQISKLRDLVLELKQVHRGHDEEVEELHVRVRYYQDLCEVQASSLQRAREALLDEKYKRKTSDKINRLEHLNAKDRRRGNVKNGGNLKMNPVVVPEFIVSTGRQEQTQSNPHQEGGSQTQCNTCGSPLNNI